MVNRDQFVTGMGSTTQTETKIRGSINSPLTTKKNQFELGKKPFSCRARKDLRWQLLECTLWNYLAVGKGKNKINFLITYKRQI